MVRRECWRLTSWSLFAFYLFIYSVQIASLASIPLIDVLRLDQSESVKCAGELSPVHEVSEGNAKFNYTTTNLSPLHEVSEGNAGESLCALGSYIHEGCAAHLNQETKKQPKSEQSNHLRSKRSTRTWKRDQRRTRSRNRRDRSYSVRSAQYRSTMSVNQRSRIMRSNKNRVNEHTRSEKR